MKQSHNAIAGEFTYFHLFTQRKFLKLETTNLTNIHFFVSDLK